MALTLDRVSFSYRTKYQTVHAVKESSCTFEPGSFYALVGKSGSGKTTLLSLMAGLEKVENGTISLDSENLNEMDTDRYRREDASVIYQSYNLFPLMTVLENVMYPLLLNGKSKTEAAARAKETLSQVGLGEAYLRRLPAMLSGGEQQRVAIARAIAIRAKYILADEPTGNLDAENTQMVVDQLKAFAHNEGCCVIVVTHDLGIAAQADKVFRMDSGYLTEDTVL